MDTAVWQAHLLPALAIGLAAFMQGITGFGLVIIAASLLMILYFAYTELTPAELRGTSVVFFLISGIISIGFSLFQGVPMYAAAVESIYLIPALVIGLLLGHAVIRFVFVKLFCFMIFFMLYFICAYMFYELAVQ
ncbi:hypothetical protein [Mitsuokella sp.]|uniref:hypothetical protein n=1 Tax=Mitsuokella sp. TaxID=2049034 RepID=UPI002A81EB4B|nr:hypothetical protein [Mitsuokella sp.]MDY4475241.1 hypothetical protein [Mitsuokella sp.]